MVRLTPPNAHLLDQAERYVDSFHLMPRERDVMTDGADIMASQEYAGLPSETYLGIHCADDALRVEMRTYCSIRLVVHACNRLE